MIDGFLGTRASLMFDFVVIAMIALLPLLGLSIYLVRVRSLYQWHKRMQLALALILLTAVGLFELEIQLTSGTESHWRARAAESPYAGDWVGWTLMIHLVFAISTPMLWAIVIGRALRNFPVPPHPNPHSAAHKFWAWLATVDLALTSVTGWIFYYVAFVASG